MVRARVRSLVGSRAVAAMVSQGLVAVSSLVLQIFASRRLGSEGLGRFSLLVAVLITLNSLQSGWIGDSLTVLDRFDPGIRRALFTYQYATLGLVGGLGLGLASLVDGVGARGALLFGLACLLWAGEETGRRLLIARRDFWALAVNDACYGVGAFAYLGAVLGSGSRLTLTHLVISLATGAAAAMALALVQIPFEELRPAPRGSRELRRVAGFAVWRSAQVGLRPGSLAAIRFIVSMTASIGALGRLEGARLVLAPVLTVANGAGVYLLPTYTEAIRMGRPLRPTISSAMAVLGSISLVCGLGAIALTGTLTKLLTAGTYRLSSLGIFAWALFSAGFAMGIPVGNAVVAHGRSRAAFWARCADSVGGVLIGAVFAALGWVDAVPFGLALGTALGIVLLLRNLRRTPKPAAVSVATT